MVDRSTAPLWEMPAWMEPYRLLIGETGGNTAEELLRRLHTERNLSLTNLPVFVLATAVQAQVHLLRRLHAQGGLSPLLADESYVGGRQ